MVCPSTPADPALALTSCHAFDKTSSRYILSYSAWNRRVGLAFAARYRARWSSRTFSRVVLARWALTSAYLPRTRRPSTAPFHPRALPRFLGSMGRSDSRSALAHFTGTPLIGFDAPSPPLSWHPRGLTAGAETGISCSHDGCLTVPRPLRRRVLRGCTSKFLRPFHGLRLELPGSAPCWSLTGQFWRRGRLRLMLRTGESHPPKEGLTPRFGAQVSPNVGGLLQR
jgi:hypothetical protein